jgi:hypothetical protein
MASWLFAVVMSAFAGNKLMRRFMEARDARVKKGGEGM